MPKREIDITIDNTAAEIRCGKTKVKLAAMDAEQFPMTTWHEIDFVTMDGKVFTELVDNTKYATPDDHIPGRYSEEGIVVDVMKGDGNK